MTTIIYSDKKSTASLGNIFGYSGPKDWSLRLDFLRGDYKAVIGGVQQDIDFKDYLTLERSIPAGYFDAKNRLRIAGPNQHRVGKLSRAGDYGLILEDRCRNVFSNPLNPVSHTDVVTYMPSNALIVLSCEGAPGASVTLTGSITSEYGGTVMNGAVTAFAGQGPVVAYPLSGVSSWSLTYVVSGSVSSVSATTHGVSAHAKAPLVANHTLGQVLPHDLARLTLTGLSSPQGTLLVCGKASYIHPGVVTNATRVAGSVVNADKSAYAAFGVRDVISAAAPGVVGRIRQAGVNRDVLALGTSLGHMSVAVRWDASSASVASFGSSVSIETGEGLQPTEISLGGDWAGAWLSAATAPDSGWRGVIQLIQYHPRALTNDELKSLSASLT